MRTVIGARPHTIGKLKYDANREKPNLFIKTQTILPSSSETKPEKIKSGIEYNIQNKIRIHITLLVVEI
jgi:hypothetical protein